MFDVKPVDGAGRVDVRKLRSVSRRLNLRNAEPARVPINLAHLDEHTKEITITPRPVVHAAVMSKDEALHELETEFSPVPSTFDATPVSSVDLEYGKIMEEVRRSQHLIVRSTPVMPIRPLRIRRVEHSVPASEPVRTSVSRMRPQEVATWYQATEPELLARQFAHVMHPPVSHLPQISSARPLRTIIAGIIALLMLAGGSYIFSLKKNVIEGGTAALQNLEQAQGDIANLDFEGASDSFAAAYSEFTKAGDRLDDLGSRITSWVSELPGGQALESAQRITKVGALIADTGKAMAQAVGAISKTGFLLNPQSNSRFLLSEVLAPLREALALSDQNLNQAATLLQEVDSSVIPEEKRPLFDNFKSKLPAIVSVVKDGQDYLQFLESFMGVRGTRKYLILFQNSTELRPNGGFPGNYGVVTVENGKLKNIFVDDVYNLDGQLKERIVPPQPLQHITPTWGMRDAGWFIDFPASARKSMALFRKEAGYDVDGVITVSPKIIQDMLKIVGPIDLPAYHLTITSENFLPEIQNEVEYGENKKLNQPKKIIADLAPIVLERLYSAQPSIWLSIFQALVTNVEHKEMLMYFRESELEDLVLRKGFGGQVSATNDDYLTVNVSNVKGAKTDAVTDSIISLQVSDTGDGIHHIVRITRTHNGGKSQYGFYNWRNPSYVRVLVPQGAKLVGARGADITDYGPTVDYSEKGFIRDGDVMKLEETFRASGQPGVVTYEEAGKTGFAFWMVVEPGATQTVELEYVVPQLHLNDAYRMLVQKQPGLVVRSFDFRVIPPQGMRVTAATPALQKTSDGYVASQPLNGDMTIRVQFE